MMNIIAKLNHTALTALGHDMTVRMVAPSAHVFQRMDCDKPKSMAERSLDRIVETAILSRSGRLLAARKCAYCGCKTLLHGDCSHCGAPETEAANNGEAIELTTNWVMS